MNTRKWIKHAKFHFFVFLTACSLSTLLFLLHRMTDFRLLFRIGDFIVYLWLLNPLPVLTALIGLFRYLTDRKRPEERALIGKKWLALPAVLICTPLLWLISGCLVVALTGGV